MNSTMGEPMCGPMSEPMSRTLLQQVQSIEATVTAMFESAHDSQWSAVQSLRAQCEPQIARFRQLRDRVGQTRVEAQQINDCLLRIIRLDAKIRRLASPTGAKLDNWLRPDAAALPQRRT